MSDLRAIAEAATPGPWAATTGFVYEERLKALNADALRANSGGHFIGSTLGPRDVRHANAVHIAAWSPNRTEAALDVIEAAQRREQAEEALADSERVTHGGSARDRDRLETDRAEAVRDARAAIDRWEALP